jgi:hypothetical protein
LFADHSICFPIPNTVAQVNYFRAFLNGYSILDLATPLDTAIALAPLLLTSQVGVKVATVALISIDIVVNPLGADAWLIIIFQVTPDLLWAPVLADHLFNPNPHRIRNTGAQNL